MHFDITLQAKAYRVVRSQVNQVLKQQQLNPTLWSLLTTVGSARNGLRLTEVAANLGVKAPLITMMSNELIARQLIERIPHMLDRRAKLLVITQSGKRLIGTVQSDIDKRLDPGLAELSDTEMEACHKTLQALSNISPDGR